MIRAVTSSRSIRLLRSKKRVQKEERSCFARSDLASQISSLSESAAKEKPEIVRFKSVQGEALLAFFAFIPKSLSWLRFSGRIGHHRRSSAPTSQNLGRPTPCSSRPPYDAEDRGFLRFGICTSPNVSGVGEGRKAAAEH